MAISNELSGDIATAILVATKDRTPRELTDLKEVILEVHSTLQQMTETERLARLRKLRPLTYNPLIYKSMAKDS